MKNKKTLKPVFATYPIPVIEWKRKPKIGRILPDWPLDTVKANCEERQIMAMPVNPDKMFSSWQTAKTGELTIYSKLKEQNPYKARLGARVEQINTVVKKLWNIK